MSFSMPPSTPPDDESRRRDAAALLAHRRRYDEIIAVVVALAGIGGIFWWTTTPNNLGFNLGNLSLSPTAAPTAAPLPASLGAPSPAPANLAPKSPSSPAAPSPQRRAADTEPQAVAPSQSLNTAPASPAVPFNANGSSGTPVVPVPVVPSAPAPAATEVPKATAPTPKATISFADLPNDYWATPYIQELGKRGILEGVGGNFLPDKPVTRAEFAAMVQKAFFDRSPSKTAIAFKDILPDYWGLPAINEAVKLGFMNGYTDGNFRATQPIPKLQGIVAIATGLQIPTGPTVDVTNLYQDSAQIPPWAKDKLAQATQAELVVNYPEPKTLNPAQPLTRADAAALIYQGLVKAGKVPPITSNYVVKP